MEFLDKILSLGKEKVQAVSYAVGKNCGKVTANNNMEKVETYERFKAEQCDKCLNRYQALTNKSYYDFMGVKIPHCVSFAWGVEIQTEHRLHAGQAVLFKSYGEDENGNFGPVKPPAQLMKDKGLCCMNFNKEPDDGKSPNPNIVAPQNESISNP